MNRRIILSLISIVSAVSLLGGAAYAFFSDVGTSTNNSFASGTFDLKLTDASQTALDDVSETWTGTNMAPGGATVSATLSLRNSGTVAGDHVHFKAANTPTDVAPTEDDGTMAKHLEVTVMTYDAVNILPLFTDYNGNGHIDLEDLQSGGDGVNIGALTDTGVDHPLVMGVRLDSATNDTYQGDSVNSTFTATLHQDASQ